MPKTECPSIYAYEYVGVESHAGCIKVGYTERDVEGRVKEQNQTGRVPFRILGQWKAVRKDGTPFSDAEVHGMLEDKGMQRMHFDGARSEWFRCSLHDVEAAVLAVRHGLAHASERTKDFAMRPEQEAAAARAEAYFRRMMRKNPEQARRFLWNCKMRFGKTFAAYQLARRMGMKRILILTFKPAVQSSWRDDLLEHIDFEGWQFIARDPSGAGPDINEQYRKADADRPIVCFGSFQDFLGYDKATGGIKPHHRWVRETEWDMVVFDEYHYGAWRDSAKSLFKAEADEDAFDEEASACGAGESLDETWLPVRAKNWLYLSGTPFRALQTGEFLEEQICSWTYSDEQLCKEEWPNLSLFPKYRPEEGEDNPYAALPRMNMYVYQMPPKLLEIAEQGEFDEFDLNAFFAAEGTGEDARFLHEDSVQAWLDLIRGAWKEGIADSLKLGSARPEMPYSSARLLSKLLHAVWFLPDVASCHAMANMLARPCNVFYHGYAVNVCAGSCGGSGAAALGPVRESMADPLKSRTITLTCGKLLTGVTVPPWSGIFMLRNLSAPETYFQAAFRVQSPWVETDSNGRREIVKDECFIFDFALTRSLRQVAEYSRSAASGGGSIREQIADFVKFLPVIAFDGGVMKRIEAEEVLDIAMTGTSAAMLARRWNSALLVHVDNLALQRLMDSKDAMAAIGRIEAFRSIPGDAQTIVDNSAAIKKLKQKEALSPQEKKQISDAEKEIRAKRKAVQEKLIKFCTRIPIFMYLTDNREESLNDVIEGEDSELFEEVTGLTVDDFRLLVDLKLFNSAVMNESIYVFRRYEESSLSYAGIKLHDGKWIGLWDSIVGANG